MTLPERTFILTNILKDRDEHDESVKWLGAVINPRLFADKDTEETYSEGFVTELMQQSGKTREEVEEMLAIEREYDTVVELKE